LSKFISQFSLSIQNPPKIIDNPHRTKESGIYVPANATWLLAPEIMNEATDSHDVVVSITYEYIPRNPPPSNP
jgi:hypothetical protein